MTSPISNRISVQQSSGNTSLARLPDMSEALFTARSTVVQVGEGSGVIVGRSGDTYYVLTNAHVVANNFDGSATVDMPDGTRTKGRIVKSGAGLFGGGTDLAIIRVQFENGTTSHKTATLTTAAPPLGETVIQAGYPSSEKIRGGQLNRIGRGLKFVSATVNENRQNRFEGGYGIGINANLGIGSSGGAVLNRAGQLIGLSGREARGALTMAQEDGTLARADGATKALSISGQVIRRFCSGIVPGM
jgi:S1-C subfamily serine protease